MATLNQCMHCATRQQACTAAAAAVVHPLRLPQPQSLPEPQSQSLAEARARMDAQHARAKQAQDEYRRLQLDFAQLQQHCRSKDVARARLLRLSRALQLAQLGSPKEKGSRVSGIHDECPHERAAPTPESRRPHFVWPSREQLQEAVQGQQDAAAAQQEAMQRLQRAQRARDVLVSIARSRAVLHPYIAHGPHSSYTAAPVCLILLYTAAIKARRHCFRPHRRQNVRHQSRALVYNTRAQRV